ncbi:MAG: AMP-dependent synthetase, partial [Isosphaeraceae bacterium]
AEVESALIGHPGVVESAAVGVPDDLKGEVVWCYVVLHAGFEPNDGLRDELRSRVAGALGKPFAPSRVLFVAELPRTRSAKVLRRAVRARALGLDAGDLSGLENPGALEAIDLAK